MSGLEQLKTTFFDECGELLLQLEAGLTGIREGAETEDTVNAIFRAVHSVKGGAGVFGFTELIAFAHVFETVLDALRHRSLVPTPDTTDVLFRASDTLSDLVAAARDGGSVDAGFGGDVRAALEALIGSGAKAAEDAAAPAELDGLEFTPVRFDDSDDADDEAGLRLYAITLRPRAGMMQKAIDPLPLFDALRLMGRLDLAMDTAALPALAELQHDQPYIGWSAWLQTGADRAAIAAVFSPVAQDCELTIADLTRDAVPKPAPEPFPVVAAEPPALVVDTPAMAKAVDAPEAIKDMRPASGKAGATTIRVELDKIDRVVNMVGELVIAQAMLGQVIEHIPDETSGRVSNILADLVRHTRGLKDSVMAIRAQPVGSVFQRMPRLVRELSVKTAKKVQIEMHGETTEVDKTVIERLSDPLTHIIRNSIDHGIEAPAERIARGKAETGTIRLSAEQRGGRIVIEISDDGAGIACDRVLKKARERGLVDPGAVLTEEEICNLIFLPGFSTSEVVSDISGRGVGMDVVRRNIQDLGGRTALKSEAGRGMTIQLTLPLTLAVMDGMVVQVGSQTYVLPIPNIVECIRPTRGDIYRLLGTSGTLQLRGDIVPLAHLGEILGVAAADRHDGDGVVIITEASDGTRLGIIVDELCGHQQVVIKSIEQNCGPVKGIAGATILGDGHVAFILDVEAVCEMMCQEMRQEMRFPAGSARAGETALAARH